MIEAPETPIKITWEKLSGTLVWLQFRQQKTNQLLYTVWKNTMYTKGQGLS